MCSLHPLPQSERETQSWPSVKISADSQLLRRLEIGGVEHLSVENEPVHLEPVRTFGSDPQFLLKDAIIGTPFVEPGGAARIILRYFPKVQAKDHSGNQRKMTAYDPGCAALGFEAPLGIDPVLFPLQQVFSSQYLFGLSTDFPPTVEQLRAVYQAYALVLFGPAQIRAKQTQAQSGSACPFIERSAVSTDVYFKTGFLIDGTVQIAMSGDELESPILPSPSTGHSFEVEHFHGSGIRGHAPPVPHGIRPCPKIHAAAAPQAKALSPLNMKAPEDQPFESSFFGLPSNEAGPMIE
ncbi:MAG: Uncharacterised protein [Flavobacteriia bacterium]|nr:MAG: Uncharacterised protein [Flavobacteriia bacterium]